MPFDPLSGRAPQQADAPEIVSDVRQLFESARGAIEELHPNIYSEEAFQAGGSLEDLAYALPRLTELIKALAFLFPEPEEEEDEE